MNIDSQKHTYSNLIFGIIPHAKQLTGFAGLSHLASRLHRSFDWLASDDLNAAKYIFFIHSFIEQLVSMLSSEFDARAPGNLFPDP